MPEISEGAHMGVMEATSIAAQKIYAIAPSSPIESRASNFEVNLDWHQNPLSMEKPRMTIILDLNGLLLSRSLFKSQIHCSIKYGNNSYMAI